MEWGFNSLPDLETKSALILFKWLSFKGMYFSIQQILSGE